MRVRKRVGRAAPDDRTVIGRLAQAGGGELPAAHRRPPGRTHDLAAELEQCGRPAHPPAVVVRGGDVTDPILRAADRQPPVILACCDVVIVAHADFTQRSAGDGIGAVAGAQMHGLFGLHETGAIEVVAASVHIIVGGPIDELNRLVDAVFPGEILPSRPRRFGSSNPSPAVYHAATARRPRSTRCRCGASTGSSPNSRRNWSDFSSS